MRSKECNLPRTSKKDEKPFVVDGYQTISSFYHAHSEKDGQAEWAMVARQLLVSLRHSPNH